MAVRGRCLPLLGHRGRLHAHDSPVREYRSRFEQLDPGSRDTRDHATARRHGTDKTGASVVRRLLYLLQVCGDLLKKRRFPVAINCIPLLFWTVLCIYPLKVANRRGSRTGE